MGASCVRPVREEVHLGRIPVITLFLDYDGVLHPDTVYLVSGEPELLGDNNQLGLFCWIDHLIEVIGDLDLEIVLSTTWKDHLGFERAAGYLPDELRWRVIGHTVSHLKFPHMSRYRAIRNYVNEHNIQDWIALDDDDEEWSVEDIDNLVLAHGDSGISAPDVQHALRRKLAS